MVGIIRALWWILGLRLKSRERIEAENLALRHQLNVVCRARKRVRFVVPTDSFSSGCIGCGRACWIRSSSSSLKPSFAGIGAASRRSGAGNPEAARVGQEFLEKSET